MKPVIFIQTNHKQRLGAAVSAFSMKSRSSRSADFDVRLIELKDQPELARRHDTAYTREGRRTLWDNDDLQSFTPLRFLAPQLMGFSGRALVIDPDVFAAGDVWELLNRDMQGKAILCRRIRPSDGRADYWATSVMLLDCAKLAHWDWNRSVADMFAGRIDYRNWMSLLLEPQDAIGELEEEWNHFDRLEERTKLLHNTSRITQPWKTGLPIDFTGGTVKARPPKWGVVPRPWIERVKAVMKGEEYSPRGRYRAHPDPKQEKFFFKLLKECVEAGAVSRFFLASEIEAGRVRPDAATVLESLEAAA